MNSRNLIIRACVVGGIALGGVAVAQDKDADVQAGQDKVTAEMRGGMTTVKFPNGIRADADADVAEAREDIREVLGEAVEAALTKGGFSDMVERFVDQDRNRIGDLEDVESEQLDGVVELFRQNWQTKYDAEFDVDDDRFLGHGLAVTVGEVQDANLAMAHWPVSPTGETDAARPAAGARVDNDDELDDANLEDGRTVAIAAVPFKEGKALHVSMISEAGGWKIDLPDDLTRQQLHNRVSTVIRTLNANQDQWPATEAEAYDKIGKKLLTAMHGIDDIADDRAQPAGGMQNNELDVEIDAQ